MINAGNIQNQGIELALNTIPFQNEDWEWGLDFTWTKNTSKIVELHPDAAEYISLAGQVNAYDYRIGSVAKVGGSYGMLMTDILPARDDQGRVLLNYSDTRRAVYERRSGVVQELGDMQPDFLGSMSTSLRWKNLSLHVGLDMRIGGFVAADKDTINWLRHNSRSYIFSASNTPAATAAARAALHILKSEPERRENLWKITNYALDCFRQAGFEIGDTESPIIPLYVRDTDKTFEVTKLAFDEGIFINPVIPPACAPQDTLVRVALMATHTKEQVDYAVDKLTKCFKKLEIIK